MKNAAEIKFGAFNPRQNLPSNIARKRGESNFVAAFQRMYISNQAGKGIGGRYFALSGYGIADFVWMDLGGTTFQPLDENRVPKLFAFEMKLKDWKRALTQAYRYSYFADKSFVVMPPDVINSNKLNLELFRTLDIGFIIFDSKTSSISILHEPQNHKPRNTNAKLRAVGLFANRLKLRQENKLI